MEQEKRKKKIIIALVILGIIAVILVVRLMTRPTSVTKDSTGTKTGVDLGQLDPKNKTNPDGTPIVSGTNTNNTDGSTGIDANGNRYSTIGNGTDINGTNSNGTGANTNGNGTGNNTNNNWWNNNGNNSGGGSGADLVDITGGNNGGQNGNGTGTDTNQQDPCTKAYADMTTSERNLCLGGPGSATEVEDNSLFLTDKQKQSLDDLDRAFYRTAPALANTDILADYKDEKQDYEDQHNSLTKLIVQCINIIDSKNFQEEAGVRAVDGRTWYRGNPKNGYTPGMARVSGEPAYRPRSINIGYYYNRYYGEDPTCKTCGYSTNGGGTDAFARRGDAGAYDTYLENIIKKEDSSWFDRGTFLRTTLIKVTPNNGRESTDPDKIYLRQFEELFEIY